MTRNQQIGMIVGILFLPLFIVTAGLIVFGRLNMNETPAEPPLTQIAFDDFTTFSLDWSLGHGWAHVPMPDEGGMVLSATSGGDDLTRFGTDDYGDVGVGVRLRVDAGEARLYIRHSATGSYALLLDAAGQIRLYRGADLLAEATLPDSAGWHAVRLTTLDDILTVAVDGEALLTATDEAPLPPGGIALGAAGDPVRVYVDDFTIWLPAEE